MSGIVLLLFGFVLVVSPVFGKTSGTQSVKVRGILLCNGEPAENVLVKVYDEDTGFDMDDLMDKGTTNARGRFELAGHVDEEGPITPKLNIYHDCNDGWKPCQRKISNYIPARYVSEGVRATRIFDIGILELSTEFEGETRDCFH